MIRVESGAGGTEAWVVAHETLSRLAKRRATFDWEEGVALLEAERAGVHHHLGCASFVEYVERLFGYCARTTEEKLRTAAALDQLPELAAELRAGTLSWSAARELTRVATPDTERDWLEAARGKRVRQIEQLVSGRAAGDRPTDPARPEARRHILRFDVSAETFASFREAVARLRRSSPERLDDDALLLLMAREILQGPGDDGRASYQIAIATCDQCGRGFQQGAGAVVELAPEVVEMARCDAQHLGSVSRVERETVHVDGGRAAQDVPPAVRRRVLRRDRGRCTVPGCTHGTFLDVHHIKSRAAGGTHDDDNLVTLCSAHHRALHRGTLVILGRVSTGLTFRHADGTPYGQLPSASCSAAGEKVLRALCALGFGERQSRRALEHTRSTSGAGLSVEQWVRSCVWLLTRAPAEPGRDAG